jgi:hypothetical protein
MAVVVFVADRLAKRPKIEQEPTNLSRLRHKKPIQLYSSSWISFSYLVGTGSYRSQRKKYRTQALPFQLLKISPVFDSIFWRKKKKSHIDHNKWACRRWKTTMLPYSDFHYLIRFTRKICRIIFFAMFFKKVFPLVKAFLTNLHSTKSLKHSHMYMYSMTTKFLKLFFTYEYQKYKEFYADSKSFKMIRKIALRKSYSPVWCLVVELFTDKCVTCLALKGLFTGAASCIKKNRFQGWLFMQTQGYI